MLTFRRATVRLRPATIAVVVSVSGGQCTPRTAVASPSAIGSGARHPLLEVTSLGSGSSGNAVLIRTQKSTLLVDSGIGVRRLVQALASLSLAIGDVDAVLISHEHSDHIRELPRFIAIGKPIICTRGTSRAANVPSKSWEECRPGHTVQFSDVEVLAIPVTHDAAEPCGFFIRTNAGAITVLTDLGSPTSAAREPIAESRLVVLEANHDEAMLHRGSYPAHLKRRILSETGHLSNADCGELLATALRESRQLPTVWLAHLSESNNRPHVARQAVARRLAQSGMMLDVQSLPRRSTSETWRPGTTRPGVAQLALDW